MALPLRTDTFNLRPMDACYSSSQLLTNDLRVKRHALENEMGKRNGPFPSKLELLTAKHMVRRIDCG